MPCFYAIRHGQSEYNIRHLCNDDITKNVQLTAKGIAQAQLAAKQIALKNISKIYCSPLTRTVQTAEIINQQLSVPVTIEARLCDIHTGFDSQPVDAYLEFIASDPLHARVDGYESLTDHYNRVTAFLIELEKNKDFNCLLVAHEETMRVFKAWSENLPLREVVGMQFENCQLYSFSCSAEK
jgi:probable phosphoglycerate mutase